MDDVATYFGWLRYARCRWRRIETTAAATENESLRKLLDHLDAADTGGHVDLIILHDGETP